MIKSLKFLIILLSVVVISGAGFVFYADNFAMATIFTTDNTEISKIINSSFTNYYENFN